jgi:hypothetical protein
MPELGHTDGERERERERDERSPKEGKTLL